MNGVSKLIVLEVGEGNFDRGFAVVLRIGETGKPHQVEFRGRFPPEPEIPQLYDRWQAAYYRWGENHRWWKMLRLYFPSPTTDVSDYCFHATEQLKASLQNWFDRPQMRDLRERILENVKREQAARLILQTQDPVLRKLPWHLWQLLERRPQLEIGKETLKLEQQGNTALRQFEFQELEALLEAMDAGQELKKLVQDGRKLEKYPTVSPILALQTILDNIHERNQLTENQGDFKSAKLTENQGSFKSVSLSPDGTRILTTSLLYPAKIWDISGRQLVELKGNQTSTTSASFIAESASFSPDGTRIITTDYYTPKVWDTSGRLLVELKGNQTSRTSASFSPDSRHIVTTSYDGTVKVWNTSGKLLAELKAGQENSLFPPTASFSPDGTRIITASNSRGDGLVKIWNISGQLLTQLHAGKDKFSFTFTPTASFSPNGKLIFTTFPSDTAKLWNISGKLIKQYPVAATGASFSPNGAFIITFSTDEAVRIWNADRNTDSFQIAELRGHRGGVKSANFSSNGQFILVVPNRSDSKAKVWNLGSNQLFLGANDEPFITLNRRGIESASNFSPNGNRLVTISSSGSDSESNNVVNIWDLSDRQFDNIKSLQGKESSRYVVASPDRQHILTSYGDVNSPVENASVWDLSGKLLAKLKGEPYLSNPTFSPDGKYIFTYSAIDKDEPIRVWNLSGELVAKFQGIRAVFSPDGSRILTISHERTTAQLWDLSGRLLTEIKEGYVFIKNAIFSPDGKHIITWHRNTTVLVWDLSGKLINSIDYDTKIKSLLLLNKKVDLQKLDDLPPPSFSPDGQRILTVTYDNTIRFWNLAGKLLTEKAHQDRIKEATFSPDGQYILIRFYTGTAQIWDSSGRQFADLKGHQGKIFQASFSPDGQRIITAANDNIVRLWDLSGRLLSEFKITQKQPFSPADMGLKSAFFSQDGKQIIVVSGDGTIRTWQVDGLNELLARGCDWLKDYLATHPKARKRLKVCQ